MKKTFLSTLGASIFLSALSFFMMPSGAMADTNVLSVTYPRGGYILDFTINSKSSYAQGEKMQLTISSVADWGFMVPGSRPVELHITVNGTKKVVINQNCYFGDKTLCLNGLVAEFDVPSVIGSYNIVVYGQYKTQNGFVVSKSSTISYSVVPAASTCSGVAQVSTPQGYSCSSGVLNGTNCETTSSYNATLTGGVNYSKAIGIVPGSPYLRGDGAIATGYISTNSFPGALSIGPSLGSPYLRRDGLVAGYISPGSFTGSVPIGIVPGSPYLRGDGAIATGYIATTAGTYGGTYSCNAGDTLSGTTCTKTTTKSATPTYACSNVCSSLYNNAQASFTSSDASCTTPISPLVYTLNCGCGISATKTNLASINSSSCTACTLAADGACGAANGTPTASIPTLSLCGLVGGNASPVLESAATWDWTCIGSSSTDLCSANKSCTPDYTHFWVTIDADSCDAGNAGTTIIEKTAQCNRTDNNNCGLGGFPASGDCNAATKPADQTKLCPAARKIKGWQEVSP